MLLPAVAANRMQVSGCFTLASFVALSFAFYYILARFSSNLALYLACLALAFSAGITLLGVTFFKILAVRCGCYNILSISDPMLQQPKSNYNTYQTQGQFSAIISHYN